MAALHLYEMLVACYQGYQNNVTPLPFHKQIPLIQLDIYHSDSNVERAINVWKCYVELRIWELYNRFTILTFCAPQFLLS